MQKRPPEILTIVIPTKNRSDFFLRLLPYYRDQGFPHKIVLADSSSPESIDKTRRALESIAGDLNIEHRLYEADVSYINKISDALTRVETPFSTLGADDDFFIPSGLIRALRFLSDHSDYAVAHGEALTFEVQGGAVFGEIERVNRYDQRTIDHSAAAERLANHFSGYSTTYYSLHRTDQLCGNLQKWVKSDTDLAFGELLAGALSLIQGKAKKLDGLYMIRQGFVPKEYTVYDAVEWIATPGWGGQYERFRDCLVEELRNEGGVEIEEARRFVKNAFSNYLSLALRVPVTSEPPPSVLRGTVRSIPGAKPIWRLLRTLNPHVGKEITLPSLLHPSSAYHKEFMPIYQAITASSDDAMGR